VIAVEARKQALRMRTYLGLGLVSLIPIIFTVAFKANPPKSSAKDFFSLAASSGLNMPVAALTGTSAFLLIVVVSLFAGESISGEANWGTLRYLLVRPVTRNRVLGAKLAVASALALVATLSVPAVALAAGTIAFGWHPLVTPFASVSISQGAAVGKIALGAVYVAWCQAAYLTFSFMLSTMTDTAFGAVAGGVGLGVVSQILNNISALNGISYLFPTHYLDTWHDLFLPHPHYGEILRGIALQVPYVVAFLGLAWWWFNRKDVLS
jgi:ABC-2 type transport system permease protein